jgi:hypothetical protein
VKKRGGGEALGATYAHTQRHRLTHSSKQTKEGTAGRNQQKENGLGESGHGGLQFSHCNYRHCRPSPHSTTQ